MIHYGWLIGLIPKFRHCGFNLQMRTKKATQGQSEKSLPASTTLSQDLHGQWASLQLPWSRLDSSMPLETGSVHISCHDGGPWAQRGSRLFLSQVTHSQPDSSKQSQFCVLFQPLLAKDTHECWRTQGWLITILIPLGSLVPFLKFFQSAYQLLLFINASETLAPYVFWLSGCLMKNAFKGFIIS